MHSHHRLMQLMSPFVQRAFNLRRNPTKPVLEWSSHNLRADTVLDNICVFEKKVTRVQEEYDLVCRAKEVPSHKLTRHMHFEPVYEQLCHFKEG